MQILVALSEYLWCHGTRAGYSCQCDRDAGIYSNCVAGAISAAGSYPSGYLHPRCLVLRPCSGYSSIFSAWRALLVGSRTVARSLDRVRIVATSKESDAPGGWRKAQEV
jgi:hypothetical protein